MRVEIGVVFRPPGVLHSCTAPLLRPALQAVFRKARWLTLLAPFFDRLTADDTLHGYPPDCLFVSWRSPLMEVQKERTWRVRFPGRPIWLEETGAAVKTTPCLNRVFKCHRAWPRGGWEAVQRLPPVPLLTAIERF